MGYHKSGVIQKLRNSSALPMELRCFYMTFSFSLITTNYSRIYTSLVSANWETGPFFFYEIPITLASAIGLFI